MDWDKVCERIEAVRRLPSEFLNRIDEMVIFKPLGKAELFKDRRSHAQRGGKAPLGAGRPVSWSLKQPGAAVD